MKKLSPIFTELFGPLIRRLNGHSYQNLDAFAPEGDWEALECTSLTQSDGQGSSDGL